MKKKDMFTRSRSILSFIFILLVSQVTAQAPALLNYQGVARNAAGVPLPNQNLSLRVNIRNNTASGLIVYSETRTTQTNGWGLFAIQIGSAGATIWSGSLAGIDWLTGTKFMELEMDPAGGSNFTNLGSTQLLSVPYALNALTAGSAAPTGAAGGDLTGAYPNPVIANNAITYLKLANNSVLSSKLADLSVTDSKIVEVSGSKVTGDISGNAANVKGIVAIENGGTGATNTLQARINLGLDKMDNTSKATSDSLRLKLNIADSAFMLQSYARKIQLIDSVMAVRSSVNQKLNISDTSAMLASFAAKQSLPDSLKAIQGRVNNKLSTSDTAAMLAAYRNSGTKIKDSDLAIPHLALTGGVLTGALSGTTGKFSDTLAASVILKTGGTSSQYLMADGSVSSGLSAVRDVAAEFTATVAQASFTLSQAPSANSKVKMYINGIRISNTAYSITGGVLSYQAVNNGSYALVAGDRIQFDYFY